MAGLRVRWAEQSVGLGAHAVKGTRIDEQQFARQMWGAAGWGAARSDAFEDGVSARRKRAGRRPTREQTSRGATRQGAWPPGTVDQNKGRPHTRLLCARAPAPNRTKNVARWVPTHSMRRFRPLPRRPLHLNTWRSTAAQHSGTVKRTASGGTALRCSCSAFKRLKACRRPPSLPRPRARAAWQPLRRATCPHCASAHQRHSKPAGGGGAACKCGPQAG